MHPVRSSADKPSSGGLAGIAGALSYSHMRQLAQGHGQAGWHAHAFPLSVDGVVIVASLVLLADRRARRRSGWLPWTALAAGTAGSLAANIATAHPDPISRIIAGWPALAVLLAIKLISGLLDHPNASDAHASAAGPANPSIAPTEPSTSIFSTTPAVPGKLPADAHPAEIKTDASESTSRRPSSCAAAGSALDSRAAALLPAARAAMDEIRQDGHSLTRDTLAARLRQHGHPIRNASLAPLLRHLRDEQPTHRAA